MAVMDRLASRLERRDEAPNQELARELAASGNAADIQELVSGLNDRDKAVQSDCIKVLYEVGYIRPELIAGHAGVFMDLLRSRNNRMVWGAMIALASVARVDSGVIQARAGDIISAMETGSVITVDNGVRTLAAVAAHEPDGSGEIMRYLLNHLMTCRASELPQHAESTLAAINAKNKGEFAAVLRTREQDMTPAQMARISKILKAIDKL